MLPRGSASLAPRGLSALLEVALPQEVMEGSVYPPVAWIESIVTFPARTSLPRK